MSDFTDEQREQDRTPDEMRVLIMDDAVVTVRVYYPPAENRCPCWDGKPCPTRTYWREHGAMR